MVSHSLPQLSSSQAVLPVSILDLLLVSLESSKEISLQDCFKGITHICQVMVQIWSMKS